MEFERAKASKRVEFRSVVLVGRKRSGQFSERGRRMEERKESGESTGMGQGESDYPVKPRAGARPRG